MLITVRLWGVAS